MKDFLNRYLKILDWYIIKKYMGTFVFTLGIFMLISVVFDVSEHLDNFLSHHDSFYDIAFKYYAGFIPFYMDMLSPLINFLAVIYFTAKMANQTEIVPILSGKASFNRFLRPYFVAATLIFFVHLFAKLYLIPYTNNLKVKFENANGFYGDQQKNQVHLKLDNRTYVYVDSYDNSSHTGYEFVLEKFDGDNMREKTMAHTITYDSLKRKWTLHNFSVRYVNGLRERMEKNIMMKDTTLELYPSDFEAQDNVYSAMSMSELAKNITKEKIRGAGNLKDMQYEKWRRYLYPFASFVLTLIGVSVASRKVRGGIGLPLGIGLFLCFAYIVVDKFALVFAIKSGLSPIIAAGLPNFLFGVFGVYLLYKAPK
ncbi:YjgP/YjgQ family permease [Mucilaginibacter corticis]|uniref:YjgP/YjgQ family permease n=1 Tax=Mucilaginibacter corticis TaxID=2597670 RepID=A0A556MKY8_9SPHI|nr:LptF/LptG family permease [Mucilaginibacter corticis]TSJ40587.1 YjgP/YjgQ family permease [Mucilaginibacter corticis]